MEYSLFDAMYLLSHVHNHINEHMMYGSLTWTGGADGGINTHSSVNRFVDYTGSIYATN